MESTVNTKQSLLGMGVGDWPEGVGNERKKDGVKYGRQRVEEAEQKGMGGWTQTGRQHG